MSHWQMKLDFSEAKRRYRAGEITIQVVAQAAADEIKAKLADAKRINLERGIELESDILPLFEEIAEHQSCDVDDFDRALSQLYDWGDTRLNGPMLERRTMCWIVPA